MPAPSLIAALLLLPLAAQPVASDDLGFAVKLLPAAVQFAIDGPRQPFVGVVLVSTSPELAHYFTGLPPLLADAVVVAFGVGDAKGYQVALPDSVFPAGVRWHAQGVAIGEGGIHSTPTASFVLDKTAEQRR